jgi:hypothetical protein
MDILKTTTRPLRLPIAIADPSLEMSDTPGRKSGGSHMDLRHRHVIQDLSPLKPHLGPVPLDGVCEFEVNLLLDLIM